MIAATIGILLPAISADFNLSPGQQGLLSSAATWGNMVLAIPLSWWVSKFRPRILSSVAISMGAIFLMLMGAAPSFAILLLTRLAFGMTLIITGPVRAMLFDMWLKPKEIILANSISNALFGLVVGVGLVGTPLIIAAVGDAWRPTLYILGSFYLVLALVWIALGRERKIPMLHQDKPAGSGATFDISVLRGAMSQRDVWIAGSGLLGVNIAWAAFLSFYPTYMLDTYAMPLRWPGVMFGLSIFLGGPFGIAVGYWVQRTGGGRNILIFCGILMAATYAAMLLTGSLTWLIVLSFINGVSWGAWPLLMNVPFQIQGMQTRWLPVAVSIGLLMATGGITIGPIIAGFLQEATDDARLSLFVTSLGPLMMTLAGILLRSSARSLTAAPSAPTP